MSCGAPGQDDAKIGGLRAVEQGWTVIEGRVLQSGVPASGAYVRLLDRGGEFAAEVVSGALGQFRFFAAPGLWTVRALAAGARAARTVQVAGSRVQVELN